MLILKPLDLISGHTNIGAMLLPNNGCHRNIDNIQQCKINKKKSVFF